VPDQSQADSGEAARGVIQAFQNWISLRGACGAFLRANLVLQLVEIRQCGVAFVVETDEALRRGRLQAVEAMARGFDCLRGKAEYLAAQNAYLFDGRP
jgi:hypothetical protein